VAKTVLSCTLFERPGPENTEDVLRIAVARAQDLGIRSVVVATTTGATGKRASEVFDGLNLVLVTHTTGSKAPNAQELLPENRQAIEANGGRILTSMYAFGGIGRAVREKLGTYQLEEVVASVLRIFGDGMKVVAEISVMAADAGLLPVGEPALAIAGTNRGADTAVILQPANVKFFFDLRICEVLCKPRFY
jgi:uncharacterized protein